MNFRNFCRIDFHTPFMVALLSATAPAAVTSALAQAPNPAPAAAKPVDPAYEAAKAAFEALPEADRIAIQDALIWTGDYKSLADGKFGRGTKEAIVAFANRYKFTADGTLDAKARNALFASGKQAKDAAQFTLKMDEKTGIRIGLPMKLLGKPTPSANGQRYASQDNAFSILLTQKPASDTALQENFDAMTKDLPGGKVTYKLLKPDFFVIAGEQGKAAFYTRMAKGERDGKSGLAAMTVNYPLDAKAKYEPLLIAIANSFAPFAAGLPAPAAGAPQAGIPTLQPGAAGSSTAGAPSGPERNLPERSLAATGIAIAPGYLLTSLPKACTAPQTGTKALKIVKQSEADGLTLLSAADPKDVSGKSPALAEPGEATESAVLSFSRSGTRDELLGAPGSLRKTEVAKAGAVGWRLLAPLQSPVAGSAVFNPDGELLGLISAPDVPDKAVAGLLPQKNRPVVMAARLAAFTSDLKLTLDTKSAGTAKAKTVGEIAALNRNALFPITCLR